MKQSSRASRRIHCPLNRTDGTACKKDSSHHPARLDKDVSRSLNAHRINFSNGCARVRKTVDLYGIDYESFPKCCYVVFYSFGCSQGPRFRDEGKRKRLLDFCY